MITDGKWGWQGETNGNICCCCRRCRRRCCCCCCYYYWWWCRRPIKRDLPYDLTCRTGEHCSFFCSQRRIALLILDVCQVRWRPYERIRRYMGVQRWQSQHQDLDGDKFTPMMTANRESTAIWMSKARAGYWPSITDSKHDRLPLSYLVLHTTTTTTKKRNLAVNSISISFFWDNSKAKRVNPKVDL